MIIYNVIKSSLPVELKERPVENSAPVYVWWDDNTRSTLVYQFKGEWTLSAIAATLEQRTTLLDSASQKVVTIVNLKTCYVIPDNVIAFAAGVASQKHQRLDATIFVSPDPIMDAV